MKKVLSIIFIICSLASFSQTLKTKTAKVFQPYGSYTTREVTHGDLTYTYYTDDKGNEIRHGSFTYKYNLYQDIPFNNIWAEGKETYNVSITGKYKDGKIDGTWQFTVIRKNAEYQGKIFYNRDQSLTANFSEGKPNGLWKYSATTTWRIFNDNTLRIERSTDMLSKPTSVSIIANFNKGIPSGKFNSKIMNDYSGDFYNGSDNEFVAIFDENGNATEYDKLSLKNYKEDIYYNANISIPEYEINPDHYNIKECELTIDLDEYIYDYFFSNDFNWDELVGSPKFENGVFKYREITSIPKISFISLEMPWTLEKFLKNREIEIKEETEEECLEISYAVKNLKDLVKQAKENNDLLSDDKLLTDYVQYIPKLDSAEVFFTKAYESKKTERLKKEEEAKLLAEKAESNNDLLKQAKVNNQKIVELCINFKKGSAADLSALSPDRCINCNKWYSGLKNMYVYDCIMINKKQKNIWYAYSKYQITMNFYNQELLKNSINYLSNSNMNITLSSLNIGFNNQDAFEEIKNSNDIESANKYNENLSIIIAIQKKLLTVLNDKKLTKTLNKELKDIDSAKEASKIILNFNN